jgi:hypothetical protein
MREIGSDARLAHAICLLAEPEFGSRALAILDRGTALAVIEIDGGFLSVRSEIGLQGYVPAAVCAPLAESGIPANGPAEPGELAVRQVIQPVSLYRRPSAGSQFAAPWIVSPQETLQVIGREFQFVRVQRPNGTGRLCARAGVRHDQCRPWPKPDHAAAPAGRAV